MNTTHTTERDALIVALIAHSETMRDVYHLQGGTAALVAHVVESVIDALESGDLEWAEQISSELVRTLGTAGLMTWYPVIANIRHILSR
jgi:hypothetical protein